MYPPAEVFRCLPHRKMSVTTESAVISTAFAVPNIHLNMVGILMSEGMHNEPRARVDRVVTRSVFRRQDHAPYLCP